MGWFLSLMLGDVVWMVLTGVLCFLLLRSRRRCLDLEMRLLDSKDQMECLGLVLDNEKRKRIDAEEALVLFRESASIPKKMLEESWDSFCRLRKICGDDAQTVDESPF